MARLTQAARRARSRAALLEATARALSRYGYSNLKLDAVAADAGYTRGALYHQFADKDALVLATFEWVRATWREEVGTVLGEDLAPSHALIELARRHAVYCRRDVAGVMTALRVEFVASDHPIGVALRAEMVNVIQGVERVIEAGRRDGSIPPGPAGSLAAAYLGAVEGAVIALAGRTDEDEEVAERVAAGLLGVARYSRA